MRVLPLKFTCEYLGLIDEGETAEQTAIRELKEETGLEAEGVVECSPLMVSDPGPQSFSCTADVCGVFPDMS